MDGSVEKVQVPAFDAARIRAIDTYALVEMQLAGLLSALLGVDLGKGSVVFSRITNTRSRYAIISDLLGASDYKVHIKPYWESLERALGKLDSKRNNMIHWIARYDLGVVGDPSVDPAPRVYMLPGHRRFHAEPPTLTITDIQSFIADANKLVGPIAHFASFIDGRLLDKRTELRELFLQPVTDQTGDQILKVLIGEERGGQPPPSEASPQTGEE